MHEPSDVPPHPFDAGPGEFAEQYGPAVRIGRDGDEGAHVDLDDAPREASVSARRRPAGRPSRPARPASRPAKPTGKRPARRRRGELPLGAALVAVGIGLAAYALVTGPLGGERILGVGAGAYLAGVTSGGVIWPLWRRLRHTLGHWVTPR